MIVDTAVLIDIMSDREDAKRKIPALESADVPIRLSSVTEFELYHGLERVSNPSSKRQQINTLSLQIAITADFLRR